MGFPVELGSAQAATTNQCPSSPPPRGGSTSDNAQWWSGLSTDQQAAYAASYPTQVGGMDGLPAQARSDANMATLQQDALTGHDRDNANVLLERINGTQSRPETERIYLLQYVPPGRDGSPDALVVAAIGNPDTADNIGILVPGTGTNLGGVPASLDRMDALKAETELVPGSGDTSTIVWLGYDAPDNIPAAILGEFAIDGAPDLRTFTEGLRSSHEGPPSHNTVLGHSYGATLVGTADAMAGSGLAVDDIMAFGSPGMGYEASERRGWFDGPMVDDTSDMHIDSDHFWAGAASNDPVSYTEVHGNSPVDWSFGGQRVTTDGSSGHSEYWNTGTESLRNQAYVMTGQYDKVDTVGRRFG